MLDTAFTLLGAPVTYLEVLAFVLAIACVACNILEIHWGWPLAIASSLLYAWLFEASKLYGEAGLQLFFVATAAWGWWQWLYGRRDGGEALRVATLGRSGRARAIGAWLLGWGALGLFLASMTDSEVPYFDAFPTAGSLLGQVLLGRKFVENWPVWVVVNATSVALFASRGLWLTAVLYLVFLGMAFAGWARWRRVREALGAARGAGDAHAA